MCNIVQPHTYLFRVQSCWARHILGSQTEHFVFRHGFSFQLGSKTIFRGQLHPAQNVTHSGPGSGGTEPVPTRHHATHSTLYLPLSSPWLSTPLLPKIRYFWYFHKQRITVSQMLSFLNWIFLSTAQKCNCVRPAQGSLCWLDMRRLRNRAEQGFSISTERNKYSHSVSQGPLTAYTTTRCIRTCWGHSFTDALFENGVQSNAYFLQKINLIHRAMKIPPFWQLRCLAVNMFSFLTEPWVDVNIRLM